MRIAEVVSTFPPYLGGMGNVAYYNAKILSCFGHKVAIFIPNIKKRKYQNLEVKALFPLIKYDNAAFLPQLLWKLRPFHIIHLHHPFIGGGEIIWIFKKLFPRSKVVVTYHMDLSSSGFRGSIFNLYNKIFTPRIIGIADKIIVTTLDYARHSVIKDLMERKKRKFVEIPLGVDVNYFKPLPINKQLKQRFNINGGKIILFVSTLDKAHYFKGLNYLLLAIQGIKTLNFKLIIVGEGNLKPLYKKMCRDYKIEKKVVFVGKVKTEELPFFYNLSDFLVMSSINKGEAFGLVLLEAMACGKPVIASNLPGVRTIVEEGVNGFLVKPKDVEELRKKIQLFLSHPNLVQTFGEKGREMVVKKYNWEVIGKRLNHLFLYEI